MQDLVQDALVGVIENRFHEALAHGADVRELAAHAVDAVVAECVTLLEVRAALIEDRRQRATMLSAAEALLAAQFASAIPTRRR
ncbi:hypothetical protein [Roseicella sp. DB1501]|uniref:hypothetical protein n=1 Tax=Roseicella sp. DB1501 TaxID=2730925 RepID=UPI001490E8FD|nr:hypothetical protein [Roseicella sp. DB1501]NOG74224.1 hypothetical protein [Roseicella sp. DB1501]